jgi:hypothetical protein
MMPPSISPGESKEAKAKEISDGEFWITEMNACGAK